MGRWWDDPGAHLLQHLGVGSVAYAFVLAAILWLILLPFPQGRTPYGKVLTFVALTSPPAIMYALPLERWVDLGTATGVNLLALAFVATWRVGLLGLFFGRLVGLSHLRTFVLTFLPLTAIVATLFVLNLHRVVLNLMGSMEETARTAHDGAYGVLFLLTSLSMLAAPPLLLAYLALAIRDFEKR